MFFFSCSFTSSRVVGVWNWYCTQKNEEKQSKRERRDVSVWSALRNHPLRYSGPSLVGMKDLFFKATLVFFKDSRWVPKFLFYSVYKLHLCMRYCFSRVLVVSCLPTLFLRLFRVSLDKISCYVFIDDQLCSASYIVFNGMICLPFGFVGTIGLSSFAFLCLDLLSVYLCFLFPDLQIAYLGCLKEPHSSIWDHQRLFPYFQSIIITINLLQTQTKQNYNKKNS